jgi:hypothetical protein
VPSNYDQLTPDQRRRIFTFGLVFMALVLLVVLVAWLVSK